MKENIENLDVMIQYLDTVPGVVYFFIIFMSILMVIVVLEMNRIDRFFRKKSVNIYNEHLDHIDTYPGFSGWYSKWKSRLAFVFFVCTFGSVYLAFRTSSFEAGMSFAKFVLSFTVMISMFLLLTVVFYLQQNYAPRFQSRFGAFVYLLFLIVILIALVYFTYFSDFGHQIIYYK